MARGDYTRQRIERDEGPPNPKNEQALFGVVLLDCRSPGGAFSQPSNRRTEESRMRYRRGRSVPVWILVATVAHAADIPVAASKLSIIAKFQDFVPRDSIVFVATDPGVTKGAGVDPEAISVRFHVEYGKYYGKGVWPVAAGTVNGWLANDEMVAKYVYPGDPTTSGKVRKLVIKPGKLLKLVARRFGATEREIDPENVGDPFGPVYTAYCVTNGVEENCHCSEFQGCLWKSVSGGLGAKLVCRDGTGDASCRASCSDVVDQGPTAVDNCSGLEWEKKDTLPGSGPDAGNLHDVDNLYTWAGRCTLDTTVLCQPDAASAATCAAQAGPVSGCAECGIGEGTCDVDPFGDGAITTVWDWLNQVNAASFAGHADWRLPTGSSGIYGSVTDPPAELASLADNQCGFDWCLHPALGRAINAEYWTGSDFSASASMDAHTVEFEDSFPSGRLRELWQEASKGSGGAVRAVRSLP
jgi:hypothetical protein